MKELPPLSPRQEQALRIIHGFVERRGLGPSLRELATGLGLRTSNPNLHLQPLIKKGYVDKDPERPTYSLRVTTAGRRWLASHPEAQASLPLR